MSIVADVLPPFFHPDFYLKGFLKKYPSVTLNSLIHIRSSLRARVSLSIDFIRC
jgi:hypothetical protein